MSKCRAFLVSECEQVHNYLHLIAYIAILAYIHTAPWNCKDCLRVIASVRCQRQRMPPNGREFYHRLDRGPSVFIEIISRTKKGIIQRHVQLDDTVFSTAAHREYFLLQRLGWLAPARQWVCKGHRCYITFFFTVFFPIHYNFIARLKCVAFVIVSCDFFVYTLWLNISNNDYYALNFPNWNLINWKIQSYRT